MLLRARRCDGVTALRRLRVIPGRRAIAAFPSEEAFATLSIGEMRPFAALANEFLGVEPPQFGERS